VDDQVEEVHRLLEAIEHLEQMQDDKACARAVTQVLDTWPDHHARLRELRQARVQRMKDSGMTWQQIGDELGVHATRAQQIAKGLRGTKRPPKKEGDSDG
jgi:DNA-directed RNA polymerase sigma subunit (sigma70/sigma32)